METLSIVAFGIAGGIAAVKIGLWLYEKYKKKGKCSACLAEGDVYPCAHAECDKKYCKKCSEKYLKQCDDCDEGFCPAHILKENHDCEQEEEDSEDEEEDEEEDDSVDDECEENQIYYSDDEKYALARSSSCERVPNVVSSMEHKGYDFVCMTKNGYSHSILFRKNGG